MLKRLLVTGGLGFIGSDFVKYMLETSDYEISVLDSLTYAANPQVFDGIKSNFLKVVIGDIRDKDLVDTLVSSSDLVVNFAAESHNDNSIKNPSIFIETNVMGTLILLEAVRKYGVRFHHISTDEVFGDLPLDSDIKFTEKSAYNPSSPYSSSKAASDLLVRAWIRTFKIDATISNCSNNYGPFQHFEKFIPRQVMNLMSGRSIELYGDGKQVRDWIHVRDHSRAIALILNHGELGQTYLVGVSQERTNYQVALQIASQFGLDEKSIRFIKDRPGHDQRYAIDPTKLMEKLGFEPLYPNFEVGLAEVITWYKEHNSSSLGLADGE
jgi:dTDP-glucose 4,6-dehydratase